jgi:bifunctional non-homologous end joining protein LigD
MSPPSGAEWVHEIKHDGYRMIVWHDGDIVRLYSPTGPK